MNKQLYGLIKVLILPVSSLKRANETKQPGKTRALVPAGFMARPSLALDDADDAGQGKLAHRPARISIATSTALATERWCLEKESPAFIVWNPADQKIQFVRLPKISKN